MKTKLNIILAAGAILFSGVAYAEDNPESDTGDITVGAPDIRITDGKEIRPYTGKERNRWRNLNSREKRYIKKHPKAISEIRGAMGEGKTHGAIRSEYRDHKATVNKHLKRDANRYGQYRYRHNENFKNRVDSRSERLGISKRKAGYQIGKHKENKIYNNHPKFKKMVDRRAVVKGISKRKAGHQIIKNHPKRAYNKAKR